MKLTEVFVVLAKKQDFACSAGTFSYHFKKQISKIPIILWLHMELFHVTSQYQPWK